MIDLLTLRRDMNLSQNMMAEKCGITQQSYQRIEAGKSSPSVETAKKIAAVLGFDWWLLFEDGDEKEEK